MASLPKPMLGLLLGTVALFAIWMVALKPGGSSSAPGGSQRGDAKLEAPAATAPVPAKAPAPATAPVPAKAPALEAAISAHKVVAVLFYNPAAADDRAMRTELDAISTHGGQVVKLAVPVSRLTEYPMITEQIPVAAAPELVLIDRSGHADELLGFADQVEIRQRIADALAAR